MSMALWHDVYRRQRASSIDGQKCDATGDATGRDTSGNAIGPDRGCLRADTVKGTCLEGVEQRCGSVQNAHRQCKKKTLRGGRGSRQAEADMVRLRARMATRRGGDGCASAKNCIGKARRRKSCSISAKKQDKEGAARRRRGHRRAAASARRRGDARFRRRRRLWRLRCVMSGDVVPRRYA